MAEQAIRFVDLPSQYSDIEKDILAALEGLIHRGAFVGGEMLAKFEKELAEYTGVHNAIGCSDGTMALVLALRGAGIQPGQGVVVPANSFIASANAVVHAGGKPVLVDCDRETFLIDLNQTESALKASEAAYVMPVHLYGNPCPMKELLVLTDKYGAKVIEDNAQAIGAMVEGRRTGSFGTAAGVSFYPAKNLGAFGQGGAVLTDDEEIARTVQMYVEQGQGTKRYHHDVIGYNGRLHSLQACILGMLLHKLDGFNAARLMAADWYAARLPASRLQKRTPKAVPVYHLMEYRCDSPDQRDELARRFEAEGVGFGYHYPVPIHKQKAYAWANHLSLPVAEMLSETLISLPMHPNLDEGQVERVCRIIGSL